MVTCLERGADLHMAQLMPLPLTVSCFSKIHIGLTFLELAHPCVCVRACLRACVCVCGPADATDIHNIQAPSSLALFKSILV